MAAIKYHRRSKFRCDECDESLYRIPMAPMLRDDVWAQLAAKTETLCSKCFFGRAIERQVDVTFASLRPCAFNLSDQPASWFDLFLSAEDAPITDLNEWRKAFVVNLGLRGAA